jgi:acyl transferase domain-containing protein/thioesterase domain-containing protein/acyl carrier protein
MALAGGVTIEFPHGHGYLYREGEILSRDGHCRAFDADSSGTVFSSGAGLVVLRRLEDALADHDTISAVILGSAINNDGARKAGYLAPSVDGQCEVIAEALGVAGVAPRDISYVETHGTGTKVGDPIEIKALTQAFQGGSKEVGFCAIGSLKASIGHLDTAAGVAGLIKTVLALQHRQIPPSLHFHRPNPLIDFSNSPFYVNTALTEWEAKRGPRRAGVTSLGIGGTNAHVVLEEASLTSFAKDLVGAEKPFQLLVMSAKTESALEKIAQNLGAYLQETPEAQLQDIAYTLQVGRKEFAHRRVLVAASNREAGSLLRGGDSGRVFAGQFTSQAPGVVFLFSGQGSQYVNMGRELYDTEPVFRTELDLCLAQLPPSIGLDLRAMLYPTLQESSLAGEKLSRTCFTQPALFTIEYALAQWWIKHGVVPVAMLGHSIGEYVAACLSGVFSLKDALHISALRGGLMDQMPRGSMLSVSAKPDALCIPSELSLAVVNGPEQCVVAGPTAAIQEFALSLERQGIASRALHTSHAFHSSMMDPMLESFRTEMAKISLHAPTIPYISNLTGTWITSAEATDPHYWTNHLRNAVQFSRGLEELFRDPSRLFLEVGPGQVLTSLARQHPARPKTLQVFASTRYPHDQVPDSAHLLSTTGQLWIAGCSINWNALYEGETPHRIALPTYPFERQRFWIEPGDGFLTDKKSANAIVADTPKAENDTWFHKRVWKQVPFEKSPGLAPTCWLVFLDQGDLGGEISNQLETAGHQVIQVLAGAKYQRVGAGKYVVSPGTRGDYHQLFSDIAKNHRLPTKILHLWSVLDAAGARTLEQLLDLSFYSLLFLAQAIGDQDLGPLEIICVSNGLNRVSQEDAAEPARAALLGPVRVIPKEFPGKVCRHVDLEWKIRDLKRAAGEIIRECAEPATHSCVSWRHSERLVEDFEPTTLGPQSTAPGLKEKGVYWITGGLGGIGLLIAEHLARTVHARLVLTGRTPLPPPSEWEAALAQPQKSDMQQKIRKLRELESLGAEILVLSADVTDREQMEKSLRTIRQRFGELHGIIHAAGLIEDGPSQLKTRESAARVLAPKVQGTMILRDVLHDCKLDFWLLFSSISSITPPPGQIDYAAANAFLDAFAHTQTGQPTTALNWGLWTDVGMATQTAENNHAILGRRLFQSPAESVYSSQMNCEKNWLLDEHRLKSGQALIPGTGYLHLAAAALIPDQFEPGVVFEDVFFLAPLSVEPQETKEVRLRLRRQRSGFRFSILAKDQEWIEYASGQVRRNQKHPPARQNVSDLRRRCSLRSIQFDDEHRTLQERYFDFGPRWRNLRTLQLGAREALAELQLGEQFLADFRSAPMHPALLDLATGSSLYLIRGYEDSEDLYLPLSYKRITFFHQLAPKMYSHIRCHQDHTAQREIVTFDFTLLDADSQVLAEIEEFSLRRIAVRPDKPVPLARPQVTAKYSDLPDVFSQPGISAADGIKALDLILSSQMLPNVIVMRGDLSGKTTEPAAAIPAKSAKKADGGVESVLAEWWQELLGVEHVSLDDDFFDLGGHSLIAVRLFSKIKKTFRLDLGLATLFEARTVKQLAALIRQTGTPNVTEEAPASAIVSIREQGTHLPIFLISGLGGEVIGFDTLARHLGNDQPVFALQPQGLDGRSPYLTRVEDMADYYLREIRNRQPHGPYCLAGYSFGGYVIFEMAQQLLALGERVALLGFLDTIEWQYFEGITHPEGFRKRWALRLNRLKYRRWNYIKERLSYVTTRIVHGLFQRLGRPLPQSVSTLEKINLLAMAQYRPTIYPGKLTIFRSVTRDEVFGDDELLGWGGLVSGGIEVQDVTGGHLEMLIEPNVRVLAEKLRMCLDGVQIAWQQEVSGSSTDLETHPTYATR